MSIKYGWWKFAAYNTQSMYGYGSDTEANAYCEYLNRGKDINHRSAEYLADDDDDAQRLSGVLDIASEGVNLDEALAAIAD